jgi:eukaryotic-like serine/threonine-protein kinase
MSLKKLGRYDLIRVLGKGAMGLVYEGRDPNLDRRVAIKTIKVENLSDEAAAEYEVRFRTEARSAARLQHPNIVSVYDSDRDGDIAFLVMEFVQGDDLKHHLDKGEVYTLQQTLSIMSDLLSALSYAHEQKIVHRDIKPANLLVQASGSIKLADFGVARIQDSGDATRTQGSIVGTLKYMSPEQLEGRPIDARADLFAAGVVLYQLLTGARPFDGDTDFAVIQKIVGHTPAAATFYNPKLPPAMDAVVAKSLAKSRDLRYASAQEFSAALQDACKAATDITIAPVGSVPAKGGNTTWTATMMAGESLISTESGIGTNSGTGSGTSSGTGASLVTQEVELVYWKDIKDSTDVEDLQGFLAKFPAGIYADLARRRLKNLGVSMGKDADSSSLNATFSTADIDKTLIVARPGEVEKEAVPTDAIVADAVSQPAPQAVPNAAAESKPKPEPEPVLPPEPLQVMPAPAAVATAATQPKSKTIWVLAGAALLAVAGVAFKFSGSGATPAPADQLAAPLAAASAPSTSLSTPPSASASAALSAALPASSPAPAAAASRPVVAAVTAAIAALKPAAAASRASAATAKKAATDKDSPAKDEPSKAEPGKAADATAPQSARPSAAAAAPAAANSPRTACEDRMLIGFQNCMAEQCAKPVFTNHPICAERRAMDERRREAERNR